MPTSSIVRGLGRVSPRQYRFPASYRPHAPLIGPFSPEADGSSHSLGSSLTFVAWPAANRRIGYMFCLAEPYLVRKVWWWNGTVGGSNTLDVGVFTEDGNTLLVSGGPVTAAGAAPSIQEVDCTDTLLPAGRHWCVAVCNGSTTQVGVCGVSALGLTRCTGYAQHAASGATLSTSGAFVPAAMGSANTLFVFGIANRTQVA